MIDSEDFITLKWGTLKSYHFSNEKGQVLLKKYHDLGSCGSAMMQEDTLEQKNILCELIDLVPGDILLDWTGDRVSKEDAKKYVLEYKA